MAAEINILSSEILEHPEMCYDFDKSIETYLLDRLLHFVASFEVIPDARVYTVSIINLIGYDKPVCIVPEWMGWLIMHHKRKRVFEMRYGKDKWHYARVFIHKCIDESANRSRSRIRRSNLKPWQRDVIDAIISSAAGDMEELRLMVRK